MPFWEIHEIATGISSQIGEERVGIATRNCGDQKGVLDPIKLKYDGTVGSAFLHQILYRGSIHRGMPGPMPSARFVRRRRLLLFSRAYQSAPARFRWCVPPRGGDGILDHRDDVWDELHVWQDLDQDGVTDDGEMRALADLGIERIDLAYDDGTDYADLSNDVTVFGNTLLGLASYYRNGEIVEGGVGDVSLRYDELGWRRVETAEGYRIELESGDHFDYAVLDGSGSADVDLVARWLDGATGDDRGNDLSAADHVRSVQIAGGDGDDVIEGGQLGDYLSGDGGADRISGGGGNDQIFFDADDVSVDGGRGYDTGYYGGTGGLTFDVAANAFERLYGGDGNDDLRADTAGTGWSAGTARTPSCCRTQVRSIRSGTSRRATGSRSGPAPERRRSPTCGRP